MLPFLCKKFCPAGHLFFVYRKLIMKKNIENIHKTETVQETRSVPGIEHISNYEIMKRRMEKEFLKYDQQEMIQKFHLLYDETYIYLDFLNHSYRVNRINGLVQWSADQFVNTVEAGYNEAMTIYDVLCNSKPDCHLAGEFVNMKSLSSIQGSSTGTGSGLFHKMEIFFDHKNRELAQACERLNGWKAGKGDVAYEIALFEFLPLQLQFWNSDEDFGASLQLFVDKNILQYMHYETVWFAMSHFLSRLKEEMELDFTE